MSDDPRPPGAMDIANLYLSIALNRHPSIISAFERNQKELCGTGYFSCGVCDPFSEGNPGCKQWWTVWWDLPECANGQGRVEDPLIKAYENTVRPINERLDKAINADAKTALTQNLALSYSNERASEMLYNSMYDSVVSILSGMIYTLLEAGVFAGYIAGASQVYRYIMNRYTAEANNFIQSYEPYNPPPIGLS